MAEKGILLISHGNFEKEFLDRVANDVQDEYSLKVELQDGRIDLSDYYDIGRRQYDANRLLAYINSINSGTDYIKIGLFRVDLFIPILTYIFGQAAFGGSSGIASLYRLRNEHYGMKKDEALLLERFTKIVNHEIGHTRGLIHCHIPSCVMRSSTYVEDIDQKSRHLCNKCRAVIH